MLYKIDFLTHAGEFFIFNFLLQTPHCCCCCCWTLQSLRQKMQCLESRWHQITALHNKCMNGTTSNCCVYVDKSTTKCVIIIFIDEIIMSVVLCCDFQVIFDICHSHCHYRSRLPLAKGAFSHFSEHQCLWSEGGHKLIYSHLCIHTQIIIGLCLLMPRHLSDAVRARCAQRSRNNNGK